MLFRSRTVFDVRHAVAVARYLLGFVFVWAFADKLFGLGYSTTSGRSWINGGSPSNGFLSHVEVGPFQGLFRAIAGNFFVDALFMVGLLGIGVALMAGVALRLAAVSGSAMMLLMWAAEWPLARHDSTGELTSSVNPFVDYHLVYAIAMIVIALTAGAGVTWGLSNRWRQVPIVAEHPVLW